MTEPSGLEYCVRDRDGRIVVAWRPVGELVAAVDTLANETGNVADDIVYSTAGLVEAEHRVWQLLGLEPAVGEGGVAMNYVLIHTARGVYRERADAIVDPKQAIIVETESQGETTRVVYGAGLPDDAIEGVFRAPGTLRILRVLGVTEAPE